MSNEPQPQKCLTFEKARAVQESIEQSMRWASNLVSLAERDPNAYRVELVMGGVSGETAAGLQAIAVQHRVVLNFSVDPDAGPASALRAVFDRPGSWYAKGEHHRLGEGES